MRLVAPAQLTDRRDIHDWSTPFLHNRSSSDFFFFNLIIRKFCVLYLSKPYAKTRPVLILFFIFINYTTNCIIVQNTTFLLNYLFIFFFILYGKTRLVNEASVVRHTVYIQKLSFYVCLTFERVWANMMWIAECRFWLWRRFARFIGWVYFLYAVHVIYWCLTKLYQCRIWGGGCFQKAFLVQFYFF